MYPWIAQWSEGQINILIYSFRFKHLDWQQISQAAPKQNNYSTSLEVAPDIAL